MAPPPDNRVPEAVLLIGIQGAGKSTFCRQRFFDSHVRLNLDMLRTRARERRLLEACVAARMSFVVDNTSPLPEDRARYIAVARPAGFRIVGFHLQALPGEAISRVAARARQVPPAVVVQTSRRLVPPSFEEGFDVLYEVMVAAGSSAERPAFQVMERVRPLAV
jgi:predicted kinase